MMSASLTVAAILVAAATLAFELGISSAIAEVLAEALLGALLEGDKDVPALHILANVGMLGLMFMAGFEVDAQKLRQTWRKSFAIGICSLALPAAGSFAVAHLVLGYGALAAGLIAVALSTTSLALVYHALKERGMLASADGQVLMAAASVVDVLSMVALAMLLGDVGWGTAIFLLAFVPVVFGLPRLGRAIFAHYNGSVAELELRFLLVILLALGVTAEHTAGVHPAAVAFAAGLAVSDIFVEHDAVARKLKAVVFSFLAPIFFLEAGMKLSLGAVNTQVLTAAAVLFVTAAGLKFAGTALPARRLLNTPPALVGILFNYRLSFGVIAASVGLSSGVLADGDYAMLLLVILASAALPAAYLRQGGGRRDATAMPAPEQRFSPDTGLAEAGVQVRLQGWVAGVTSPLPKERGFWLTD